MAARGAREFIDGAICIGGENIHHQFFGAVPVGSTKNIRVHSGKAILGRLYSLGPLYRFHVRIVENARSCRSILRRQNAPVFGSVEEIFREGIPLSCRACIMTTACWLQAALGSLVRHRKYRNTQTIHGYLRSQQSQVIIIKSEKE